MSSFFNELKASLEEIIAYKQGKLTLHSEYFEVPEPPKKYKAKDIKKIRVKQNLSQGSLARYLNVSIKTVQSWESGKRMPSGPSLRLLEIIDKGIYPVSLITTRR